MLFTIVKIGLAAGVITFASWLSGKKPELAGFITALPLASILALAFSFVEHDDPAATIQSLTHVAAHFRPFRLDLHSRRSKILHRQMTPAARHAGDIGPEILPADLGQFLLGGHRHHNPGLPFVKDV